MSKAALIPLYRDPPVFREHRVTTEVRWVRLALIGVALAFLALFLVIPLVSVFYEALRKGLGTYVAAIADSDTRSAIRLTLLIAAIAVPLNLVFGVIAAAMSSAVYRHPFSNASSTKEMSQPIARGVSMFVA